LLNILQLQQTFSVVTTTALKVTKQYPENKA